MVVFPPCKINLGLHVISKRPDGYHNIETCFYPVPWTDMLEIIPARALRFTFSGATVTTSEKDNLCVKAYLLLKQDFPIPPVQLHLHKVIPSGAGLGGGSSDAAATLSLLNEIFSLDLSKEQLRSYAGQLGSDCPFFVDPLPMIAKGRGELLSPASASIKGKFLVLLTPDIHSATAEAYQEVNPRVPAVALNEVLKAPFATWKDTLSNDFETTVFRHYPRLRSMKEALYHLGAQYTSMSGSGSSIFGLFDHSPDLKNEFNGIRRWTGWLPQ